MKYDVITFGSAILDVYVKSPDMKVIKSAKSLTGKYLAVPYGIKAEASHLVVTSGGGGTNTAVGLSRLGVKTALVARLGWDLAGKSIRTELKKEGVDDGLLCQYEGEATDWSVILLGPGGNRTVLVWRGQTRLERSLFDLKRLNSFWFYIASLEGNVALLRDLLVFAKENHIKVALNPGGKEIQAKEEWLDLAGEVAVFMVNKEEAALLAGLSLKEEEVLGYLANKVKKGLLVVTDGSEGVWTAEAGENIKKHYSLAVTQVDQSGAGDAFGSGLVAGLIKGKKTEEAIRLGIANGAAAVTKIGAKQGLLTEEEAEIWAQ